MNVISGVEGDAPTEGALPVPSAGLASRKFSRRATLATGALAALGGVAAAGVPTQTAQAAEPDKHVLVSGGVARTVIVVEEPDSAFVVEAANELQSTVARSTGVTVPIVADGDPQAIRGAIRIGRGERATRLMKAHGVELELEEYWIHSCGQDLLVVGNDVDLRDTDLPNVDPPNVYFSPRSPATLWAVHRLLDRHLGVRWLWPGEGGTAVPHLDTVSFPQFSSLRVQPPVVMRRLRSLLWTYSGSPVRLVSDDVRTTMVAEMRSWQEHHGLGERVTIGAPHSFGDRWWKLYGTSDPELFALPPAGYAQPWPSTTTTKLRLSNPDVVDKIVAEWEAAGRPPYWNVAPNDSTGFDTHPDTMATDHPLNQDPLDIWLGKANLSARYLKFWRTVLDRLREQRPDVILLSLAYGCYSTAPDPASGVTSAAGMQFAYTTTPWGQDGWQAWSDLGAGLVLRPNWWNSGATSPAVPLHLEGGFFEFAGKHSAAGFDFDSIYGGWANQSIRFYTVARLSARPELGVDEIVAEYAACFGAASEEIKEYIDYWEDHTMRVSYPLGSQVPLDPDGLYATTVTEHGLSYNNPQGSLQVIPYLYDDATLDPAIVILDRAAVAAAGDADVLARIEFLRSGLTELVALREVLALRTSAPGSAEHLAAIDHLQQVRAELTPTHAVWGETSYWNENRAGIFTHQV